MARRGRPDPSKMHRHFVVTMNVHPLDGTPFPDPADADSATDDLDRLLRSAVQTLDGVFGRNLRYRIASLEKGAQSESEPRDDAKADSDPEAPKRTGLHLQCYVETSQSIRLRTVWRGLPYAYVRPRRALRDTARDYCMPDKGSPFVGSYDPTHVAGPWEIGEWIPSSPGEEVDSPLDAATDMVLSGCIINEVAKRFPRVFVRHGTGLVRLHRTLFPRCSCCSL